MDAQVNTADWLQETGLAGKAADEASKGAARNAFVTLTSGADPSAQKEALIALEMPEQVRHVVGMLTAYDWEFVDQAKQLRGFVVARLVEEANGAARAGDRIKALTALGKVTEVGLFTEKIEVQKTDVSDEEINKRIKDKIAAFLKIEDAVAGRMPALPGAKNDTPIDVEPQ